MESKNKENREKQENLTKEDNNLTEAKEHKKISNSRASLRELKSVLTRAGTKANWVPLILCFFRIGWEEGNFIFGILRTQDHSC